MSFAGGAMVFPGGAVDEADFTHARELLDGGDGDVEEMAARIAAVRETIEECGLLLASYGSEDNRATATFIRDALKAGTGLAEAARGHGIAFDFTRLIAFARWCPPARVTHKRFDTRFFLAVLESEEADDELLPDGNESVRLVWHSAREVLEQADAERIKIIFPTRRNLERLALCATVDELVEHVRQYPVETIMPWIETRGGKDHLCIPEGRGYPVTSEPLSTAKRM